MKMEDNRKSFRVKCKEPICTQISIVKVNNKTVTTGTGNICLENISSGGLKFLSGLNMPVSDGVIIEFKLVIGEELTAFHGYIVRKEELANGVFSYGIKFINDITENEQSIKKLNELNQNGNINKARFCYGNALTCLKKYEGKKNINLYKKCKFSDKVVVKMCMDISNDKDINFQWEEILINNISPNGIEFTSDYRLLGIDDKIIEFKIAISDREISEKGYIFRQEEFEEGIYSYKVKFDISDSEKKILAKFLNNGLRISIRKSIKRSRCFTGRYNQYRYENKNFEWWA